jgi:hypothetical protein
MFRLAAGLLFGSRPCFISARANGLRVGSLSRSVPRIALRLASPLVQTPISTPPIVRISHQQIAEQRIDTNNNFRPANDGRGGLMDGHGSPVARLRAQTGLADSNSRQGNTVKAKNVIPIHAVLTLLLSLVLSPVALAEDPGLLYGTAGIGGTGQHLGTELIHVHWRSAGRVAGRTPSQTWVTGAWRNWPLLIWVRERQRWLARRWAKI